MRLLFLALIGLLCGCASQEDKAQSAAERQERDRLKAMTERGRKSKLGSGDAASERGAEVIVPDYTKEFNPSVARFGNRSSDEGKSAQTGTFRFTEKFRTKEFASKEFGAKSAWLEKLNFTTKAAPATREAREAGKTAMSKAYATTDAREAGRIAAIPNVPDGERKFLGKEADRMKRGIDPAQQEKFENSWNGNLEPMTIEQVKKLLNKN